MSAGPGSAGPVNADPASPDPLSPDPLSPDPLSPGPLSAGPASGPLDPAALGMVRHPEGGWFRETWRTPQTVATPRGERALATCVAFLLQPGERSAWHRVTGAELWLWQGGGPLRLGLGGTAARPAPTRSLLLHTGAQHLVAPGEWQEAEPAGDGAVLVACIVSPGFDFADFTLADGGDPH